MSGLSSFLGNLYGESDEPGDDATSSSSSPSEPASPPDPLKDVRDSMEALLAETEEAIAETDPPETDDDPLPNNDASDWFAAIDSADATPAWPARANTGPANTAEPEIDPPSGPPPTEEWFAGLHDVVSSEESEPSAVETTAADPQGSDEPSQVPPPPETLITEDDFRDFPGPSSEDTRADPWLEEILDEPPVDAMIEVGPEQQDPRPEPQDLPGSTTSVAGPAPALWESGYDDIIPGKVTAAIALHRSTADDAVAEVIPLSTERRRSLRGRRSADDTTNPLAEVRRRSRRRLRRRQDDLTTVDLPPPSVEEIIDSLDLPDPTFTSANLTTGAVDPSGVVDESALLRLPPIEPPVEADALEQPISSEAILLEPPTIAAPPEGEPEVGSAAIEPSVTAKERRRGLLGRRAEDDARNMVKTGDRKLRRRKSQGRHQDPEPGDFAGLSAAEIMGLDSIEAGSDIGDLTGLADTVDPIPEDGLLDFGSPIGAPVEPDPVEDTPKRSRFFHRRET